MDFDYTLLAKYLVDTLSREESEAVAEWRNLSEENGKIFSGLVKLRVSRKYMQYNTPEHIEKALDAVNAKIGRTSRFRLFRSVVKYAAVALMLLSLSYAGWEYYKPETCVTIAVKHGEDMKQFMLADGTSVWLKGGSSLKYPASFGKKTREVSLQGEAYFDVSKYADALLYIY